MHYHSQITIQPVANGFILTVPIKEVPEGAEIFQMLPKMMDNMNKDEIIRKSEEKLKEAEAEFSERNIDTYRERSVFTFSTFREVLFFLADRFDVSISK